MCGDQTGGEVSYIFYSGSAHFQLLKCSPHKHTVQTYNLPVVRFITHQHPRRKQYITVRLELALLQILTAVNQPNSHPSRSNKQRHRATGLYPWRHTPDNLLFYGPVRSKHYVYYPVSGFFSGGNEKPATLID